MLRQNLLDEEFESLRRIALSICNTLGRPKDREICKSTLEVLARFNQAQSVTVKQNVHDFMVFYLKVLRWTYNNQPMGIYQAWYGKDYGAEAASNADGPSSQEVRAWLEEGKSFMAMKTFEDGSTIIYSAVAKDPMAGWAENGLKSLMESKAGCSLTPDDK
ncbi:uncharacterized protein Dana_GF14190 [Drosophila ananassae]|uniref:Uncharacterized protein n=1 Tax=Drosophila ananassae TaxID=7217 RepID=B3MNV5_DROAN|nr:uncharacterized protein LOC6497018 [Drosophila ananassae]EDV32142.1 uncharacterized protein Dana_GF14190 [Drosophila ananassae]